MQKSVSSPEILFDRTWGAGRRRAIGGRILIHDAAGAEVARPQHAVLGGAAAAARVGPPPRGMPVALRTAPHTSGDTRSSCDFLSPLNGRPRGGRRRGRQPAVMDADFVKTGTCMSAVHVGMEIKRWRAARALLVCDIRL